MSIKKRDMKKEEIFDDDEDEESYGDEYSDEGIFLFVTYLKHLLYGIFYIFDSFNNWKWYLKILNKHDFKLIFIG